MAEKPIYTIGLRNLLPAKRRRQLRNIDHTMRNHYALIYNRNLKPKGTIADWLFERQDLLSRILIHIPYGLFLKTITGLMETLIPLGPMTRRANDDWHIERIGTSLFHIGSLFGLVPVVARLTSQRIVFYIPPTFLDIDDIKHSAFSDFTMITVERSIPNWNGHVASMIQILAHAIKLVINNENIPPAQATSIFFQQMAQCITDPNGPDIFAMCEMLAMDPEKYASTMLDAIDQFIDVKN